MVKEIKLTHGMVTLVDDMDFEYLNQWKWQSYIRVNYKRIHLGYFKELFEAREAYNIAATKYFGEFAYTNKEIK